MANTARSRAVSALEQRLVRERERTRQALLDDIRKVSVWGPKGLGRRQASEVLEEVIARIEKLDLAALPLEEKPADSSILNAHR